MSLYKCSSCDYESYFKVNVDKHIGRKNKCSNELLRVISINTSIVCEFCNKSFSSMANKTRHLKICKNRLKNEEYKIKKLEEENKQLKKLMEQSSVNITNITNNNTNNTINNYITISLTPYNDPNMQGMQQYLEAAVRKTFLSVPTLIESVHFNDEYPENQNICITNRRTKDAKVFDGKKWKTINKEILLNEIVDTYERELTNYAEEQGKTRYIKEYDKAKQRGNGEKDLIEEVHNVIYDNSNKINTKIKEVQKPIKKISNKEESEEGSEEGSEEESEEGSEEESDDEE
jgi:hypothetical protein